ncbi:MAG: RdgB/HAM1 family non-canonical purine NTP pyrophosphatase [Cytophagales bacterium]
MKICLATNNEGKIRELKSLLATLDVEIVSLTAIGCSVDLPETGDSFRANSLQKAQFVFDNYKLACIADDSGLEIEALNGEPGVYSARYAGKHGDDKANIQKVLEKMTGVENRKAHFKTVITYIDPNGEPQVFEGVVNGSIINEEKGSGGFGYDPIFVADGYVESFAEIDWEIKNKISHRAVAVGKFVDFIAKEQ